MINETWIWGGNPANCPTTYDVGSAREFRYDSGRQRYLNRELDPAALMLGVETELSSTWTDYDGDEPYGDFTGVRYVNDTLTETRSFEPGLGTFGWMDDGSGAGTTMPDTSTVAHYHTDLIGTTRRMSDSTGGASPSGDGSRGGGSPAGSVTYTAFGERISGTPSDRYGYAGAWGYQSHRMDEVDPPLDPDTAFPFLHVGARYYDPATGRFLQRDPIGIAGGLNVYAYLESQPANHVDPSGLSGLGVPIGDLPLPKWGDVPIKRLPGIIIKPSRILNSGTKILGPYATACAAAWTVGWYAGKGIDYAVGKATGKTLSERLGTWAGETFPTIFDW